MSFPSAEREPKLPLARLRVTGRLDEAEACSTTSVRMEASGVSGRGAKTMYCGARSMVKVPVALPV